MWLRLSGPELLYSIENVTVLRDRVLTQSHIPLKGNSRRDGRGSSEAPKRRRRRQTASSKSSSIPQRAERQKGKVRAFGSFSSSDQASPRLASAGPNLLPGGIAQSPRNYSPFTQESVSKIVQEVRAGVGGRKSTLV